MRRLYRVLFLFVPIACSFSSFSQYSIYGTTTQNSCHCFSLTQPSINQAGSVWNSTQINLNNPFNFRFNIYPGCNDAGADGIVFVLQPTSTNFLGTLGGGLGYQNTPAPSLAVEMDTWQNGGAGYNDPAYDHISIMKNGNVDHNSANALTPYVQASSSSANIEDCQWHELRISWDPAAQLLQVYFDNSLRTQYTGDIVGTIFNGNPMVYWGFVGSTGGASNLQQVCAVAQAGITANIVNNTACEGSPVQFTDSSQCFSNIQTSFWDFGDGSTSPFLNPAPHYYFAPGTYVIKHTIAGIDGCVSDTAYKTITIGAKPVANFSVNDVCFKNIPAVVELSTCSFGTINQWSWLLDGAVISNSQQPNLPVPSNGLHVLQLVVSTNYGCSSDTTTHTFNVKPLPQITMTTNGGCANQPVQFNATQTDNATTINQWHWDFGDGGNSNLVNPVHSYSTLGNYPVQLFALATNGCSSDTLQQFIVIGPKPVAAFQVGDTCAGNNPDVINNSTIASGSITQWNWILDGQTVSNAQTPVLNNVNAGNHQLQLVAISSGGCASDTAAHNFIIRSRPVISANGVDGCNNQPTPFNASQTDNNTIIQQWNWSFGDGGTATSQNPTHSFNAGGNYNVSVTATATNGCVSAPIQFPVKINQLNINAGNDTVVLMNTPFNLNASALSATNSQLTYLWTPSTGLNNPNVLNPISTLSDNIIYTLTITSAEGCVATDQVAIEVFKGSGIYVPSGFTPNHDGKNDVLRPKYIGIKKLDYFSIYNRWGQLVFTTKDMTGGWDGTIDGKQQDAGVFVWVISAVDVDGKQYNLKGTTTIIR